MNGPTLQTFATEVNGGEPIGATLLFQLVNIGKALIEQRRPWMILRKTDTSRTVGAGNTWETAIDLSTITDFNRFHGDYPIRLFDGANRIERFSQVPIEERLWFKEASNTFVFDEATKTLYLNGILSFGGTLWINYLRTTSDITNNGASTWEFPSWSHALLGFFAVGIHKGGVDYDTINARMAPENRAAAELIVKQLENWDNERQLAVSQSYDPTGANPDGFRSGAIDMNA